MLLNLTLKSLSFNFNMPTTGRESAVELIWCRTFSIWGRKINIIHVLYSSVSIQISFNLKIFSLPEMCSLKQKLIMPKYLSLSCVQFFAIPVACQVHLSMGLPRQEYWNGLPFPPPGDLRGRRLNPCLLHWQAGSLPPSLLGNLIPKLQSVWGRLWKCTLF